MKSYFMSVIHSILLVSQILWISPSAAGSTPTTQTGGSQSSWNSKGNTSSPNVYDNSKKAEKGNNIGMVANLLGAGIMVTSAVYICPFEGTPGGAAAARAAAASEACKEATAADITASIAAKNAGIPFEPTAPQSCTGASAQTILGCASSIMGAVQSLAQLGENAKKKGEYGNLANSFGCSDPKLCTVNSPDIKPDAEGKFLDGIDFKDSKLNGKKAEIKKNLAALKKAGIGIDFGKNKVTMPNGQSFDGSKLKTDKDWEKMFGEAGKKVLADANKSINDEMKKLMEGGGLDDSSSGFASSKSNQKNSTMEDNLGLGLGSGASSLEKHDLPLSTDGLSKLYNGEAVGLSTENIFIMMSRRYKVKDSKHEFLNEQGDE
jgi:hypothetical protein